MVQMRLYYIGVKRGSHHQTTLADGGIYCTIKRGRPRTSSALSFIIIHDALIHISSPPQWCNGYGALPADPKHAGSIPAAADAFSMEAKVLEVHALCVISSG